MGRIKNKGYNEVYIIIKDYFFRIDTREKAYWLGFLYADGCVSQNLKAIALDLASIDVEHIYKFLSAIQSPALVRQHGQGGKYSRVAVCCKQMVLDLVRLGCVPCKSLILTYPCESQVPREFERDFIRGYFDGDGCLSFSSTRRCRGHCKPGNTYPCTHWIFKVLGTEHFLTGICNFLPEDVHVGKVANTKISQIKCGGNRKIKEIMKSFYLDAPIYLNRKYEKFQQLLAYK